MGLMILPGFRSAANPAIVQRNLEALGITRKPVRRLVKPPIAARSGKVKPSLVPKEKPLPPIDELKSSYKSFAQHTQIYDEAAKAYTCLGHILCSLDFATSSNLPRTATKFQDYEDWSSARLQAEFGDVQKSTHGKFMRITPDYVETIIDLSPIYIDFGFGENAFAQQATRKAAAIVRDYFPGFKVPNSWMNKTDDHGTKKPILKGNNYEVEIPLEKFASIRPKYEHSNDTTIRKEYAWNGPEYYTLPAKWGKDVSPAADTPTRGKSLGTKNFRGVCYLKLILATDEGTISNAHRTRETGLDEGTLESLGQNNKITIPVHVEVIMRWPMNFVLYATCSDSRKNFLPFLFYQYSTWHRLAYASKRGKNNKILVKTPARVSHFGVIKDFNEQAKADGKIAVARTNKDDFTVLGAAEEAFAGQVTWIPKNADIVGEYLSVAKSSYNADSSTFDFTGLTSIRGKALYTDWYSSKFAFVRETGMGVTGGSDISGIQTYDLLGAIPLDPVTIDRDLQQEIAKTEKNACQGFFTALQKFVAGGLKVKPAEDYMSPAYLSQDEQLAKNIKYMQHFANVAAHVSGEYSPITWAQLGGEEVTPREGAYTSEIEAAKTNMAICHLIRTICADLLAKLDDADLGFASKIEYMRYRLFLVTKYGLQAKVYRDLAENSLKLNTLKDLNVKDVNTVSLVNLPNLPTILPHQVETLNSLATNSSHVLTDIDVGGGKTLLGIAEAMRLIYEKKTKRAIVVVPNRLVTSWINEINNKSNGQINAVPITLATARRLQAVLNPQDKDPSARPDYALLKKYIESCPPNTIFITTYNFLRCDNEILVYGNKEITRSYSSEFIRDMGFDAVMCDESHFVKRLGTAQTQGAATVVSAAKYARLMSGTLVSNDLTDLVGQGSMMNPAAFGTRENFCAAYSVNGQVASKQWKTGAQPEIVANSAPFFMRITHKKQRWAFALPKLIESFRSVHLTPNQQEFYNARLASAIEALQAKKGVAKLMVDGNEENAGKIAAELAKDPDYQILEQFVYAPDTSEAFKSQKGLSPEDLVSPKVPAINKILTEHFDGYENDDGEKVPGSAYKVIIFSARKVTSLHVYNHMAPRFKKIAKHYSAGDEDALNAFKQNPNVKILVADEGCFPGYMNVMVDYDRCVPIETVYSDPSITHVLSYDLKLRKIVKRKITNKFRYVFNGKKDEWIDITVFDKERGEKKSFRVTGNHEIFKSDGSEVRADEIEAGDKLITFGGEFEAYYKSKYTGDYVKRSEYDTHASLHRKYPCSKCGEDTLSVGGLMAHMRDKHGEHKETYAATAKRGSKRMIALWANKEWRAKRTASARAYRHTDETKAVISALLGDGRMKAAFAAMPKSFREAQIKRFMAAPLYNMGPNKIEQKVIDLGVNNLHFMGDGSYFVTLDLNGKRVNKNPDFIRIPDRCGTCVFKEAGKCSLTNERVRSTSHSCEEWKKSPNFRTNKVVEIMDFEYWHSKDEIKPLVKAYKKQGIEALILDAKLGAEAMQPRIESFINNHYVEVLKVRKAGKNTHTAGKYKYDLEVEGHHNYFVVAGSAPYTTKKPTIPILVHNSINTGQNLQIANRMIRLETLWQPGEQDQAIGRIWRPDFRNMAGRPNVYSDWIYCDNTVEVAKIARLLSKMVTKKKWDRALDPLFTSQRFIPDSTYMPDKAEEAFNTFVPGWKGMGSLDAILKNLPLVGMDIESLKGFRTKNQLKPYLAYYTMMNVWEDMEFARSRASGDQKLIPVTKEMRRTLPGSIPLAYLPRAAGTDPSEMPWLAKFEYKPVSRLQTEMEVAEDKARQKELTAKYGEDYEDDAEKMKEIEDSDAENYVEINPVTLRQIVNTEFGFGRVVKSMTKDIKVAINGLGEINVPKAAVWVIGSQQAYNEIARSLKNQKAILPDFLMKGSQAFKQGKIDQVQDDDDEDDGSQTEDDTDNGEDEAEQKVKPKNRAHRLMNTEEDESGSEVKMLAEVVDGQVALCAFINDGEQSDKFQEEKFRALDPYYAVQVNNSRALAKVLDLLNRKFEIPPALLSNFDAYVGLMRSKQIGIYEPALYNNTLKFMNIDVHKRVTGKVLRPFPIVWGTRMFIAVNINRTQAANKFISVIRSAAISGVVIEGKQEALHIRFFKNKGQAIEFLDGMQHQGYDNPAHKESVTFLKSLRARAVPVHAPIPEDDDTTDFAAGRKPPVIGRRAPKTTQVKTTKVQPRSSTLRAAPKPAQAPSRAPARKLVKPVVRRPVPRGRR